MDFRKYQSQYSTDCDCKYQSMNTRKTYKHCISVFLIHFSNYREPKEIPTQEIKEWLLTFDTINTRKQMLCSVKSFYKLTVGMPKKIDRIPYPKEDKKLPRIIDSEKAVNKILAIKNKKHKAILALALSTGLRVSEVVNLKIKDIDSDRGLIHVRNGKGRKDRIVPLSNNLLEILREYYKEYKPIEYIFNGQFRNQYSATSCNKVVKKYLGSDKHFHLIRHSALTAMLENGTDLRVIQSIAGHKNIDTTCIYTHVSTAHLSKVKTPI